MTQHTQGPWRYKMHCDTNYAIIYCHNDNHEGDNLRGYCGEANARLIAAAPELLEVLVAAKVHMENPYPSGDELSHILTRAAAAIAKAKGE